MYRKMPVFIFIILTTGTRICCRGWEQLEVTCNPRQVDKNNIWNVEGNENDRCELSIVSYCN